MYANLCEADGLHVRIVQRTKILQTSGFLEEPRKRDFKDFKFWCFPLWLIISFMVRKNKSKVELTKKTILNVCGCSYLIKLHV